MLRLFFALQTLRAAVTERVHDEETGGVAIEYALLAALIALAIAVGAALLGTSISNFFNAIATWLNGIRP